MMARRGSVICFDVGGTFIKFGLISTAGTVLFSQELPTASFPDRASLIRAIVSLARGIKADYNKPSSPVIGIGIGLPGLIDHQRGIVHYLVNIPGWRDVPLAKIVREKTALPVFIDNDVNLFALAELYYGSARPYTDVICLTLGTGVGGGIIIDKTLFRGSTYSAGEIGHLQVDRCGARCNCGNVGCLETVIGTAGIIAQARAAIRRSPSSLLARLVRTERAPLTPALISRAARANDPVARELWERTACCLGSALAGLVNVFNPDAFIIGGGIANAGGFLFEPLIRTVRRTAMRVPAGHVKIIKSRLGASAGLLGGAALVLDSR